MINKRKKIKVTKKKGLRPKLRFPEFRDERDWELKKLGSVIVAETSNLALGKIALLKNGYPVYGANGLAGFISSYDQDQDYVAIVKDGSGVGNLFYYQKESSILSTMNYLKSKDNKVYPLGYLYYLLQTVNFSKYKKGSGIPHIYYRDYANEPLFVSTTKELLKIADCLSSLDELIEAEENKLEALQQHKKSLMQELFPAEGKTLPKRRFPQFKKAPKWEEKSLREVCEKITQGGTPDTSEASYWNGSIEWLTPAEMGKNESRFINSTARRITEEGLNNCSSYLLPINSVIMSTRAPIGHLAINAKEMAINQGCKGLIPKPATDHNFLYYILYKSKSRLADLGAGNTFKELSSSVLKSFALYFPKIEEQKKIADCLSSLDELIDAENWKLKILQQHKKGLMQQLFPTISEVEESVTLQL